jgi:hypothetical protein
MFITLPLTMIDRNRTPDYVSINSELISSIENGLVVMSTGQALAVNATRAEILQFIQGGDGS